MLRPQKNPRRRTPLEINGGKAFSELLYIIGTQFVTSPQVEFLEVFEMVEEEKDVLVYLRTIAQIDFFELLTFSEKVKVKPSKPSYRKKLRGNKKRKLKECTDDSQKG